MKYLTFIRYSEVHRQYGPPAALMEIAHFARGRMSPATADPSPHHWASIVRKA
jgi:hypothetical protein